jgi:hypothetical protein
MRSLALFCCALAIVTACGSKSPTTPTPAPQQVTALTIGASTDQIVLGFSETFTVTSNLGAVTSAVWGSDAPSVASVDAATGRVTGNLSGLATVYVDAFGLRAVKTVRVLPNYAGVWLGTYRVPTCVQTGEWRTLVALCDDVSPTQDLQLAFRFTQSRENVSVTNFALGGAEGAGGGAAIGIDGTLGLTGVRYVESGVTVAFENVNFQSTQAGRITGTFELLWTSAELSGSARFLAQVASMVRIGSVQAPASIRPAAGRRSVREIIQAMIR